MKFVRKFDNVSTANVAGASGLKSPHADMIDSPRAANHMKTENNEDFTCTFDASGSGKIIINYTVTLSAGTGGTVTGGGDIYRRYCGDYNCYSEFWV